MDSNINVLKDKEFLTSLSNSRLKTNFIKIIVLNQKNLPIKSIEGTVISGSVNLNGNSSVRRNGNINIALSENTNNFREVESLLSMNKKIKIYMGQENNINSKYENIVWFKIGVFVISSSSISHQSNTITVNLQLKDKMALLNGELGGGLPTSVTFNKYYQTIGMLDVTAVPAEPNNYTIYHFSNNGSEAYYMWDSEKGWSIADPLLEGTLLDLPQRIYDIILTLVCNYGGEDISKIIINDVPLVIKNAVRYTGPSTLYFNNANSQYSEVKPADLNNIKEFNYNEDCGYIYTDLTYPGELVSALGDNICNILDKIKNTLGNFEYFYDVDGNFIFQEIKNYINTQYSPVVLNNNESNILNEDNYFMDLSGTSKSVYTFEEGSTITSSYSNNLIINNIKNDFHVWGKAKDGYVIHYHAAIKQKPTPTVYANTLTSLAEYQSNFPYNQYSIWKVIYETNQYGEYTGRLKLAENDEASAEIYIPTDWRAELYLQGLQEIALNKRPDIYKQEILDLFDEIYNMKDKTFKTSITKPNNLKYWIDYIEPSSKFDISVDAIGPKIKSYQKDTINKLYNTDVPNLILINTNLDRISGEAIKTKCESEGQPYSQVTNTLYNNLSLGTVGYSAQECLRELLHQYTNLASSINISSIPLYFLEVNTRITVNDKKANIFGDYLITSINLPLDSKGLMSVSAIKIFEKESNYADNTSID